MVYLLGVLIFAGVTVLSIFIKIGLNQFAESRGLEKKWFFSVASDLIIISICYFAGYLYSLYF